MSVFMPEDDFFDDGKWAYQMYRDVLVMSCYERTAFIQRHRAGHRSGRDTSPACTMCCIAEQVEAAERGLA